MRPAVTLTDAPPEMLLAVYLGDHLAGATAGLAVAHRCRRNNADNEFGQALGSLIPEIEQDRATLEGLLDVLDLEPPRMKLVAAAAAERAGRLKLNGQLLGYSPLSRVVELEGLSAGVAAKENLWRSLAAVGDGGVFHGIDARHMAGRAAAQREQVEELRLRAARIAFAGTAGAAV